MPRKLLLQLLACLVAVSAWGAGIPLAYAASTTNDPGGSGTVTASRLTPAFAFQASAFDVDTSYWTEKWLLASRALSQRQLAADSNTTAAAVAQHPEGAAQADATPQPNARPAPDPKPNSTPEPQQEPQSTPRPDPTPKPESKPDPTPEPKPDPKPDYQGTTHFWYPALGISTNWRGYGCEYGGNPNGLGAGVYRWGCVGGKNVYLMSHAWSTFAAIRRGYHSGRMDVGQHVWYADGGGDVSEYRVKWIRHVDTDYFMRTFGNWAAESSSSPIMTLQTCDGSNNQFRIIVRLVAV
jgi:hypothetical protein